MKKENFAIIGAGDDFVFNLCTLSVCILDSLMCSSSVRHSRSFDSDVPKDSFLSPWIP